MRTLLVTLLLFTRTLVGYCADTPAGSTNALRFYVVSDEPIAGGRYVDTVPLPKLGYISNEPSLLITGLQSVSTNTGRTITHYNGKREETVQPGVTVQFLAADSRHFAEFTRQNIGHRILLMLGDRPLIAPIVQTPIEGGNVTITLHVQKDAEDLLKELKKFVQHD